MNGKIELGSRLPGLVVFRTGLHFRAMQRSPMHREKEKIEIEKILVVAFGHGQFCIRGERER